MIVKVISLLITLEYFVPMMMQTTASKD